MHRYGKPHAKPQRRKKERLGIELCDLAALREKIFAGGRPKDVVFRLRLPRQAIRGQSAVGSNGRNLADPRISAH
jgi:hypothetical protein